MDWLNRRTLAPEQKDGSVPVSNSTLSSGLRSNLSSSDSRAATISGPRALRVGGSCSVKVSTPPSRSTIRYS